MSGKVVTEGDQALKANIARELFDIDGSGVKIGIISTSFDAQKKASDDVASGDLPGVDNPDGRIVPVQILKDIGQNAALGNDEGRAIAQIIHDLAPGAELLFYTGIGDDGNGLDDVNDEISYIAAVNALVQAGADIIVDDVQLPTAIFQDGEAAKAVQNAVSEGVTYISAAGNNGKLSYQDNYRSNKKTFSFDGKQFEAHDFDASSNVDLFQDVTITKNGTVIFPTLTWDNPVGEVTSNLEMFLLDSPNLPGQGGNVLAVSEIPSLAAESPIRSLAYAPIKDQKLYFLIGREMNGEAAPNLIKWISLANGLDRTTKYQYINDNDQEPGSSTVFGSANTNEAITVGATDYQQILDAGVSLPELRSYSSRGGSPILYDRDGDSLLNPEVRYKPEIAAPDGVSTTFDAGTMFNPFRGASASAAHIAGVVALMEQAAGGTNSLSPEEVKVILQDTATPLALEMGVTSATGLVQADKAVLDSMLFGLSNQISSLASTVSDKAGFDSTLLV
jgi:Subtilase family